MYYLSYLTAKNILECMHTSEEKIYVSFDLGQTTIPIVIKDKYVYLPDNLKISLSDIEQISKDKRGIFKVTSTGIEEVSFFCKHFYKLVMTDGYPTVEIDGIQMHRTKGITPEMDADMKVAVLKNSGDKALDICTGLGYTAIRLYESGFEVYTIENDPNVLKIAQDNPHSKKLFAGIAERRIHLIKGDAFEEIDEFGDNFFDCILHDPPRYARAPLLYSLDFYIRLARIIRYNGVLFHYTGLPGARYRGKNIVRGVMNRLREAGFKVYERKDLLGVVAKKVISGRL